MGGDGDGSLPYRAVFTNPTAWRLWAAATISYLGDFVGLGALLLVAYDRSGGRALGPAAVFGVQALPAFAMSAGIGPWLDRIPRRAGLMTLCYAGAVALCLPLVFRGVWPVLATAAALGAIRTAFNSIRTGAIADGVPRDTRGRLVALVSVSNQTSEVLGYLTGTTIALLIGAGPALIADAATFLAAALVISGLRLPARAGARKRSSVTTGLRTIFADPTLRVLAPVVWVGLSLGAMPQTLATAALAGSHRAWLPGAMAAMAAGQTIAATVVGRTRLSERVQAELLYITCCGAAFLLTSLGVHSGPALLVAGNFVIGLCMGWVVAAQTTYIHVISPARIAHVTSTMIGSLIMLEGAGAVAFGAIAGSLGVPTAYLIAGLMLGAAGLAGYLYGRTHARVADLRRPEMAATQEAGTAL